MGWTGKAPLVLTAALLVVGVMAPGASAIHPRPGVAKTMYWPLLPAFQQCTAPNTSHVSPLALPSCSPPALESQVLTTGTVGAMIGAVRFEVLCTDAQAPPCTPNDGDDTEDVKVDLTLSDVRCAVADVTGCSAVGADYTGDLIESTRLRITDHANGNPPMIATNGAGNPPAVTATSTDITFGIPLTCVPNPSATRGSNCNRSTTYDTLLPGTVIEFQRSVWQQPSTKVLDAGVDGSTDPGPGLTCPPTCGSGDERPYADTGFFAP